MCSVDVYGFSELFYHFINKQYYGSGCGNGIDNVEGVGVVMVWGVVMVYGVGCDHGVGCAIA